MLKQAVNIISPQYVAGFFDGAGSMRLRKGFIKKTPLSIRAEVKLTNTDLELLTQIKNEYGGQILIKNNPTFPAYTLYWSSFTFRLTGALRRHISSAV